MTDETIAGLAVGLFLALALVALAFFIAWRLNVAEAAYERAQKDRYMGQYDLAVKSRGEWYAECQRLRRELSEERAARDDPIRTVWGMF